ncbi:MAG: hypothetical protein Q9220_007389 [cf. Caloplaca sp. 1 TL-2023]
MLLVGKFLRTSIVGLCITTVVAKPLDRTLGPLSLDQEISSNLKVPSAFKVDITPDTTIPIDSEDIYRAAIDMMYIISGMPLAQTWFGDDWLSPAQRSGIYARAHTVGKEPSRLTSQHLIWGLNNVILSMNVRNRYCETTAVLSWQGNTTSGSQLTQNFSATLGYDRKIDVRVSYGAKPIERTLVYLTAIKSMGDAAEGGLDQVVPIIITLGLQRVSWQLARTSDRGPVLRNGYSRGALIRTLAMMIVDNKFQEIYVFVDVDGEYSAVGGFGQGGIMPHTDMKA